MKVNLNYVRFKLSSEDKGFFFYSSSWAGFYSGEVRIWCMNNCMTDFIQRGESINGKATFAQKHVEIRRFKTA